MKTSHRISCIGTAMALSVATHGYGSSDSVGPNGINASGLGLSGSGISIGQVEVRRPGKRIADDGPDSAVNANANIVPAAVFRLDGAANVLDVNAHAEQVAGVMISKDNTDGPDEDSDTAIGVAPNALLYASATNVPTGNGQVEAAISAQHIALQDSGDVRAINFSFGEPLFGSDQLNGNSLLTKFMDWSSHIHEVLYVKSGNEGSGGIPLSTDMYNGVVVAASSKLGNEFRQLATFNFYGEDAVGTRTSVDLLAPGSNIELATLGGGHTHGSGTSYAAPHVTGAVALLQEHAETRISAPTPRWDADARQPEVMKAVLMNSADKIEDDGTLAPIGSFLGMERTVVDTDGSSTWLDSNAFTDVGPGDTLGQVPLDIRLGAGHLNVSRARTQFNSGEYEPNAGEVPAIGWDYDTTTGDNSINKYPLFNPLIAGRYVSLTLAWDRIVEFEVDNDSDGAYDIGDTFVDDCCFTDIDLHLMPAGAVDISEAITTSAATDFNDNLEHIFFEIPSTGDYEIWVQQLGSSFGEPQNYALAWWTAPATLIFDPGDYNGDQIVDALDYKVWRGDFGEAAGAETGADGNSDGMIDAADYVVWRKFADAAGSGSQVPEPRTMMLFAITCIAICDSRWLECRH